LVFAIEHIISNPTNITLIYMEPLKVYEAEYLQPVVTKNSVGILKGISPNYK
jgi:hypothetical protein